MKMAAIERQQQIVKMNSSYGDSDMIEFPEAANIPD
jgi:hypothetical protein